MLDQSYNKLKQDINLLGELLGEVIGEQAGVEVLSLVESIRKLSKLTLDNSAQAEAQLLSLLDQLPPDLLVPVTKAFSQFLNFANIAEEYQRIRQTRFEIMSAAKPHPGTLDAFLLQMRAAKLSDQEIYAALLKVQLEFVFTAHPTEVKRRTIMSKYQKIHRCLAKLDQMILTEPARLAIIATIKSEMTAVWLTPEVREYKPTALDEAKWGFTTIESSVWQAVPQLMRELDVFCWKNFQQKLPLDFMPIKFDTWMAGDRDGNPFVTADLTIKACHMASWVAVDLLAKEIEALSHSLSMVDCSEELRQLVGQASRPYNFLLKKIHQKLLKTSDYLANLIKDQPQSLPADEIYYATEPIMAQLKLCYDSLVATKAQVIADADLLNVIRQLSCFGLTLMRIDIRQDASKHADLMDLLCKAKGLPSYTGLTETAKQELLISQLKIPANFIPPELLEDYNFSETLNTFRALREIPRACLANYVISMAAAVSDILLVVFFQQQFKLSSLLPVVPLFEMGGDLSNAPQVLDDLLHLKSYRDLIDNYQQVMIGYSDSAKDTGIVAASWLQYTAQEGLSKIARQHNVNLVFFHGRGGSVGRGGWPTHRAILSQPPKSINNFMRVTQQGEVIKNRFGLPEIAIKSMTIYLTATLEATLMPGPEPDLSWRTLMDQFTALSKADYQELIYHNQDFIKYFLTCTPINELDKMSIGSRPARRNTKDLISIRNIRAIPWSFAWIQNRLLLPSWFGVGKILSAAQAAGQFEKIRLMAEQWPFFHSILAMTEIVLAKADSRISLYYERRLSTPELHALGDDLREKFAITKSVLLELKQASVLLADNPILQDSINVRNPYILPLHLLQAELLYRNRCYDTSNAPADHSADISKIQQALLICIAGISAGMRNTG